MTALLGLRPELPVLLRQASVRATALLAVVAPIYVAWGGRTVDAPLRLRVVSLATAVVLAMVWEDRSAPVVAATPVGLPAVLRGRAVVLIALATFGWVLSSVLLAVRVDGAPIAELTLEAAGTAALLVAVVGVLARGRLGESVTGYPVPLLLGLLVLVSRLPADWTLLSEGPDDPAWVAVHQRWAVLLVVALGVAFWSARDPAATPHPRRGGKAGVYHRD